MRRSALLSSTLLLLLGQACLDPSLPLPPPDAPDTISQSRDAGIWEVRGRCTPGAMVLIKNLQTGTIAGAEDKNSDGRYFVRLGAAPCDGAEVYEIVETTPSDTVFFLVEPTTGGVSEGSCG